MSPLEVIIALGNKRDRVLGDIWGEGIRVESHSGDWIIEPSRDPSCVVMGAEGTDAFQLGDWGSATQGWGGAVL